MFQHLCQISGPCIALHSTWLRGKDIYFSCFSNDIISRNS